MTQSKLVKNLMGIVNRYPVVIAALVIYGYYLTTTVDFFKKSSAAHFTFLDFVLQFDSLFWMWITAFVFIKLQQSKEKHFVEERSRIQFETQIEKSTLANTIVKDITSHLQDTINNPLAVISVMTEDIRKRFVADTDIIRRLDQIDASLRRVHIAIKDVAMYESAKILDRLTQGAAVLAAGKSSPPEADKPEPAS